MRAAEGASHFREIEGPIVRKSTLPIGLAAGAKALTLAAACSTASSLAVPASSAVPSASSPSPSTVASDSEIGGLRQRAQICRDLAAWSQVAQNEDQPRFTPTLENDETVAQNSQWQILVTLGTDMQQMDNDLPSMNSLAFEPVPPDGNPSDGQVLAEDFYNADAPIPLWAGQS